LLVSNLERFDEAQKDEVDGVHNALGIFENMSELKPSICIDAAKQGLLQWLLKRIRVSFKISLRKYENNFFLIL
jgi:beta-catenin-like protein 1